MTRPRPDDGHWRDDWNTPECVLAPLRRAGPIALDPCWNETAITRPTHSFTGWPALDGLALTWAPLVGPGEIAFCNPPYSALAPWLTKCADEARGIIARGGALVALVPASVDQPPWHDVVRSASFVAFWRGRISFDRPDRKKSTGATFPSALIVWVEEFELRRRIYRELNGLAWCAEVMP